MYNQVGYRQIIASNVVAGLGLIHICVGQTCNQPNIRWIVTSAGGGVEVCDLEWYVFVSIRISYVS